MVSVDSPKDVNSSDVSDDNSKEVSYRVQLDILTFWHPSIYSSHIESRTITESITISSLVEAEKMVQKIAAIKLSDRNSLEADAPWFLSALRDERWRQECQNILSLSNAKIASRPRLFRITEERLKTGIM